MGGVLIMAKPKHTTKEIDGHTVVGYGSSHHWHIEVNGAPVRQFNKEVYGSMRWAMRCAVMDYQSTLKARAIWRR